MPVASQPPREILIRDKNTILDAIGTEPLAYYIYFDNYYGQMQAWVLYFLAVPNAESNALWNSPDYQEIILGIIPPNCSEVTEAAKIVLRTYDGNNDGYLTKDEALQVVRDYFAGISGITKEVATGASIAYQLQCDIGIGNGGCIPNWQCRQPLNNYEYDVNNCGGNDRLADRCKSAGGGEGDVVCGVGQVNIFGSCYKTSNVLLVGGAIFLVMMMKK